MSLKKTCPIAQKEFIITDEDLVFYEKMGVRAPTLCPLLRVARKMAFRNERILYKRKCDQSGKAIISSFHPEIPYVIYDKNYWYSDKFEGLDYGRDFDFTKPFFEQFDNLLHETPLPSLRVEASENCDFNSDMSRCKDCYLCSRTHESENMLYCYRGNKSSNCIDCRQVSYDCGFLYECIECIQCYDSQYLEFSERCSNSAYLSHCRNCTNCFLSTDLDRKEFYFMNEACSKEEYESKIKTYDLGSQSTRQNLLKKFENLKQKRNQKDSDLIMQSEDCTGKNINESKNCFECYDIAKSQDCRYCFNTKEYVDSADCYSGKRAELAYENTSCTRTYQVRFSVRTADCRECDYCMFNNFSQHLFGCIGLKNKKHCIFNKQYSPEEYLKLRDKIILHMKSTGEWGEFFPISISPFGYNETVAHEFFPIDKTFAKSQNWKWRELEKKEFSSLENKIPDHVTEVTEDILTQTFNCKKTGKHYKIMPQELKFYQKNNIPLPIECPEERYNRRAKTKLIPFT